MSQTPRVQVATLDSLHTNYIQKSYAFLFPWLELKSKGKGVLLPSNTYLRIKGIFQPADQKLICSYNQESTDPAWMRYQQEFLLTHPLLDTTVVSSEPTRTVYIFDLGYYQQDIIYFLQGRYSQLSPRAKAMICSYYGVESVNWAYMESYLYPDRFFGQYARLLGVEEQDLRKTGELCDRYDEKRETFPGTLPDGFVEQLPTL